MKIVIPLETEFKIWLVEESGISEASSKSYLTYVRGVNKIMKISIKNNKIFFFSLLKRHISSKEIEKVENIILTVIDELSKQNASESFKKAKKTLQNYKSGLFSYLEFLNEYLESDNDLNLQNEDEFEILNEDEFIVSKIKSNISYSKKDLFSKFKSRVKTWDRTYKNIFFPIQFITRIYREQKKTTDYNQWIEKLIDSIVIHTEKSETTFKKIKGLSIIENKIYVDLNKSQKLAYTKMSDNLNIEPFEISKIRDATIDHSISLFDIMNVNINSFPIIKSITQELKKHITGEPTRTKLVEVSKLKLLSNFAGKIDTKLLLDELILISSKTDLQLMKGSNNISKGKK